MAKLKPGQPGYHGSSSDERTGTEAYDGFEGRYQVNTGTQNGSLSSDGRKFSMRSYYTKDMQHPVVLDLFAGNGYISDKVYHKKTGDITLVEKNAGRASRIRSRFPKQDIYRMNNIKYLEKELPNSNKDFNVVDFDACGSPAPHPTPLSSQPISPALPYSPFAFPTPFCLPPPSFQTSRLPLAHPQPA
jgi:hypothetical protein